MGAYLDIDDAVSQHPLAVKQLAQLREELHHLRSGRDPLRKLRAMAAAAEQMALSLRRVMTWLPSKKTLEEMGLNADRFPRDFDDACAALSAWEAVKSSRWRFHCAPHGRP